MMSICISAALQPLSIIMLTGLRIPLKLESALFDILGEYVQSYDKTHKMNE
jgi:hypothetical protein